MTSRKTMKPVGWKAAKLRGCRRRRVQIKFDKWMKGPEVEKEENHVQ